MTNSIIKYRIRFLVFKELLMVETRLLLLAFNSTLVLILDLSRVVRKRVLERENSLLMIHTIPLKESIQPATVRFHQMTTGIRVKHLTEQSLAWGVWNFIKRTPHKKMFLVNTKAISRIISFMEMDDIF